MKISLILFLPLLLLGACSPQATQTKTDEAGDIVLDDRMVLSSDMGDDWPLTVASGTLRCLKYGGAGEGEHGIVFIVKGKAYALNNTAKASAVDRGYSDINEITIEGKSIAPLVEEGENLCE